MTGSYLRRDSSAEEEREVPPGDNLDGSIKEQDRFLPIANVGRIMKRCLPTNAKISKDAKQTVQECVSEFISFITGEASDKCQREKRKTINGDDLLWSMSTLGFENYIQPLEIYLHRYRELEGIPMPKQGDQSPPSRGTAVRSAAEGTHSNHYNTTTNDNNSNGHTHTHRGSLGSRVNGSFYSGIPHVCGSDDGTGPWRR